jgi:hypothetical protein
LEQDVDIVIMAIIHHHAVITHTNIGREKREKFSKKTFEKYM